MAVTGQNSGRGSIVSGSSVIAAGLASALAAAVTSSAGWAGGLLGAAVTTMIITGGSAILNAYLQSAKSRVQAAPGNIRAAAQRVRPQGGRVDTAPVDSPEGGKGFVERLRRALGWFSRIPAHQRRSILKRGLIGAGVAFVIGVLAITAIEFGIGNSLSCGIWSNCPATSAPGFNGGNAYTAEGARSGYSVLGGRSLGGGINSQASPYEQPGGGLFGGNGQQAPQQSGGGLFGGGGQQPVQPTPQQPVPQQPAQPQPTPQQPVPQQPAQPQPTPQQPAQPAPAEPAVPQTPQ
ncbi:hypothetical protein [Rubrobacter aplysinae]|uniref:hypothetical protein n=1 Tax=Rubrobacter aplysinae TaxID=909625 RepID=UPI00064C0585|nr:hypothetical protein [Rubrobacter aplysinae]